MIQSVLFTRYLAFTLYDTDKNGAIDLEHFAIILKSLNIETNDDKIKVIVEKVDTNHDGQIDFDEFVNAMTTLLTQPETITSEPTPNGYPNAKESEPQPTKKKSTHKRNYSRRLSSFGLDELRLCFDKFDKNGDGQISTEELKDVMTGLGEQLTDEEIKDMMSDADANNDGFIDFSEFKALMPSKE